MKLDEMAHSLRVCESVCVDAKSLHHAVRSGNPTVTHGPHEHVRSFAMEELKVPEIVVCGLRLGYLIIRLRL